MIESLYQENFVYGAEVFLDIFRFGADKNGTSYFILNVESSNHGPEQYALSSSEMYVNSMFSIPADCVIRKCVLPFLSSSSLQTFSNIVLKNHFISRCYPFADDRVKFNVSSPFIGISPVLRSIRFCSAPRDKLPADYDVVLKSSDSSVFYYINIETSIGALCLVMPDYSFSKISLNSPLFLNS